MAGLLGWVWPPGPAGRVTERQDSEPIATRRGSPSRREGRADWWVRWGTKDRALPPACESLALFSWLRLEWEWPSRISGRHSHNPGTAYINVPIRASFILSIVRK